MNNQPKKNSIADIYYDNNGRRNTAERNNKTNNNIIPSLADILKSISDNKSSSIFLTIADANSNREISPKNLGISRKQYYSRISAMMETDLIKRQRGRYCLTPLGKVIYCCTMIAKAALDNYYNLKSIEAIEASHFSNEEFSKLVDALINNQQIKEFLTKRC